MIKILKINEFLENEQNHMKVNNNDNIIEVNLNKFVFPIKTVNIFNDLFDEDYIKSNITKEMIISKLSNSPDATEYKRKNYVNQEVFNSIVSEYIDSKYNDIYEYNTRSIVRNIYKLYFNEEFYKDYVSYAKGVIGCSYARLNKIDGNIVITLEVLPDIENIMDSYIKDNLSAFEKFYNFANYYGVYRNDRINYYKNWTKFDIENKIVVYIDFCYYQNHNSINYWNTISYWSDNIRNLYSQNFVDDIINNFLDNAKIFEDKYMITNIKHNKYEYYRIKSLKYFSDVRVGDVGGFVQSYDNLSQDGDCWIYDDAMVLDNAKITESAVVRDDADIEDDVQVSGNAEVYGKAELRDKVIISGNSKIYDKCKIEDSCDVTGNVEVYGESQLSDNVKLYDNAKVYGFAKIHGFSELFDNVEICGTAEVYGYSKIGGSQIIKDGDFKDYK